MNNTSNIHWDEYENKLHTYLTLTKDGKVKAELNDCHGVCIKQLFNKIFHAGHTKVIENLKDISNGFYTVKITYPEGGCQVIRFSVLGTSKHNTLNYELQRLL